MQSFLGVLSNEVNAIAFDWYELMLCSIEGSPNILLYGLESIVLLQIYGYASNIEVQKLFDEFHDQNI